MEPRQRIGNAERERATEELARHYSEGRLDHDEYTERLDAAWTARTEADLRVLFTDLPRSLVTTTQAPVPARRSGLPFWWKAAPVIFLVLVLVALLD